MRRPFFVVAAGFVLGEVFALQMKMAGMETAEIETVGEAAFGAAILIFVCLAGLWRFRLNSGKEKGGRGKLLPFCVGVFALTAGVLWAEARIFTLDAQEQWVKERQEKGQGEFIGEIEQIEETGNGWELVIKNLRERNPFRIQPQRQQCRTVFWSGRSHSFPKMQMRFLWEGQFG